MRFVSHSDEVGIKKEQNGILVNAQNSICGEHSKGNIG